MRFQAANPFIRQTKTDKGWIVQLEVSQDQYDIIKELPTPSYQERVLTVSIDE